MMRKFPSLLAASVTAAAIVLIGSPASALSIDDVIDWLFGDSGSKRSTSIQLDNGDTLVATIYDATIVDEPVYGGGGQDGGDDYTGSGYGGGISGGGDSYTAPVPEPSAALLFGAGSLLVAGRLRKRR